MAQAITFPPEFERHFFRDLDRNFFTIWLVTFVLSNALALYFAGQPPRQLTADQVKKFTEALYRVKATPPPRIAKEKAKSTAVEEAKVEEKAEETPVTTAKPQTAEDKAVKVAAERAARKEKQERHRQAIANKVKVVAGATVKGGLRRGGAAAASAAIGLEGGASMEGFDITKTIGMVSDAGTAGKVKKLRGAGAVSADVGDIDIAELKALSAEDLNLMLKEAAVQINRSAITAKGSGSKAKQRSQDAISNVVLQNQNQVKYCYWVLKRRDSSLKGKVVVEFTVAPSGEVMRVNFRRESNWGGNALGEECQRCIENVIKSWHFDAIGASEGNVTFGATFFFE